MVNDVATHGQRDILGTVSTGHKHGHNIGHVASLESTQAPRATLPASQPNWTRPASHERRPPISSQDPARATVAIPWDSFPHIIDQVLASADLSALCTFRLTSTYFKRRVEAELGIITITESPVEPLAPGVRVDDDDESRDYTLSLHTRRGQHLWSFTTVAEQHGRVRRYKMRRPTYSPRTVGLIHPKEQSVLEPLTRTRFPLVITVVGDCVRRHRLLLGILDILRPRPGISLHFQPDAQGCASQLAWRSPWPVTLLENSRINWWSGAYLYDAPRVTYRFSGAESEVVVGPRMHGGERLRAVVFDFSHWVATEEDAEEGYPTRATQLAARAAAMLAPERAVVFRGLDGVDVQWLDPNASETDSPKQVLLRQALGLSPVPTPVVADTQGDAFTLSLPPPPPVKQMRHRRWVALGRLTISLPTIGLSTSATESSGSIKAVDPYRPRGLRPRLKWRIVSRFLSVV